jgi:hypothetical protein
MKKSLLFGILGLAAGVATSYGQGYVSLDNYSGFGSSPQYGLVHYLVPGTQLADSSYTVGIYFAAGAVASDTTEGNGLPTGLNLGTGAGSTTPMYGALAPGMFQAGAYFQASPLSTATTVTLEVVAYNGASYAASGIRGHSAAFNMTTAVGTGFPQSVGDFMAAGGFTVTAIPEPTTLALGALGGLALLAFRRKQA